MAYGDFVDPNSGGDWYDTLKKMGPGLFDLGSSIYNRSALSGDAAQRLQ